jgi:hypothetical protein
MHEIDVQIGAIILMILQQHASDLIDLFDLSILCNIFWLGVCLEITQCDCTCHIHIVSILVKLQVTSYLH